VIYNGGTLKMELDPGAVDVPGNYVQASDGTLVSQVAGRGPGQYDFLDVKGHATLAGALVLEPIDGFQFKLGDKFSLVVAQGGISGQFSSVSSGTILLPHVSYQGNDLLIGFTQGSFVSLGASGSPSFTGLTPNQNSVAQDLDTVLANPKARPLISFLDNQAIGNLPYDFDLISPDQLTAIYNISFAAANVHQSNLEDRMEQLRNGSLGFVSRLSVSDSRGAVEMGNDGKASISDKGKDMLAASPDNPWGVFISGNGDFVNVGGDYNAEGYDFTTGGVTIGIDYRLGESMAVGIALDYAHTWTNLTSGGSIDANSGRAGVYATLFRHGVYLNAYAGGGYNSYYTQRAGLGGNASGNTDGAEFDSFISTGYDFHSGAWTFGPTASVAFTNVGINPYTESGSLAPLTLNSQNQDSVATTLGWEISYAGHVKGILITPEASAAWEHQYAFSALPFEAQLASGAGGRFTVHGPDQGRDSAVVGAGVNVQWSPAVSWNLRYDGILNGPYQSNDITGGLNIIF
jgi:outer membrane autotransporter protein